MESSIDEFKAELLSSVREIAESNWYEIKLLASLNESEVIRFQPSEGLAQISPRDEYVIAFAAFLKKYLSSEVLARIEITEVSNGVNMESLRDPAEPQYIAELYPYIRIVIKH